MAGPWPDQPELMRTALGSRIIARAASEEELADVTLIVAGILISLELEESARLRGLLQTAEDDVRRRRAPDGAE